MIQVDATGKEIKVRAEAFWLPKAGHRASEYEDAFVLPEASSLPLCAAVADGATEAAFARIWAERLVRGFQEERTVRPRELAARLPVWQEAWRAGIEPEVARLPWYAAAKAEQGAYAAFLGLSLEADCRWYALAVGDCCLFHLRGAEERLRWPVDAPEAFHHRPALLASRPGREVPAIEEQTGRWQAGDVFLLATDALAAYLMRTESTHAWRLTPDSFADTVASARAEGNLRNDDVTLVVLELGS